MTYVQLKYVVTVAGYNLLNDAAKVLFITQPSLSSAICSLEKKQYEMDEYTGPLC